MTAPRLVKPARPEPDDFRPTVHETLTAVTLYVCAIAASLMLWHELLRLIRWLWR